MIFRSRIHFPPVHSDAAGIGDLRHRYRLQIFFPGVSDELIRIFRSHDHRHSPWIRDRQLGAVETFIFLRNEIQIDVQTVCQFPDRYGYAAGAEIVAALDQRRNFISAEQSLEISLPEDSSALPHRR